MFHSVHMFPCGHCGQSLDWIYLYTCFFISSYIALSKKQKSEHKVIKTTGRVKKSWKTFFQAFKGSKKSLPQFFCALHFKKYELKKYTYRSIIYLCTGNTALHRNPCQWQWFFFRRSVMSSLQCSSAMVYKLFLFFSVGL